MIDKNSAAGGPLEGVVFRVLLGSLFGTSTVEASLDAEKGTKETHQERTARTLNALADRLATLTDSADSVEVPN